MVKPYKDMEVDLMRWIDREIGSPICFALFIFKSIGKFLGFEKVEKDFRPKKVLFIELSEMGSTVLAYSAIKASQKLFPGSKPYFLIFKENRASVDLLDIMQRDNVLTIRSRSFLSLTVDTLAAVVRMRREKIDVVLDLELFSRFTAILSYLSGARLRVGFYRFHMEGLYRGNLQTHNVAYNPYQHMSLNFLALLYALKEDAGEVPHLKKYIPEVELTAPKIRSTEDEKRNIFGKLKSMNPKIEEENRIVLINPNASKLLPIRKWPLKNYILLAKRISEDKNVFIVVTGVRSDLSDGTAICDALKNERCINLVGRTTLRELIDLYNISDILITNDSGPAHFSSLTEIKTIVFYGPETPTLYGPLGKNSTVMYSKFSCSPCVSAFNHRKSACNHNRCLEAITVDKVYPIVRRLLNEQ